MLAFHLLLIHVVGAPHEELPVADFAHLAHSDVSRRSVTFLILANWADHHALFNLDGLGLGDDRVHLLFLA